MKYGYRVYVGRTMGRVIDPQQSDAGDRLLETPNPPPLAPEGETPSSRLSRDDGDSVTSVSSSALAALEDTGDYIPLSS